MHTYIYIYIYIYIHTYFTWSWATDGMTFGNYSRSISCTRCPTLFPTRSSVVKKQTKVGRSVCGVCCTHVIDGRWNLCEFKTHVQSEGLNFQAHGLPQPKICFSKAQSSLRLSQLVQWLFYEWSYCVVCLDKATPKAWPASAVACRLRPSAQVSYDCVLLRIGFLHLSLA